MKDHSYITTPIYYATARPHLGSLYSTVIADVFARWQRLQGKSVFFMTGTDEHGQKIATAAIDAGKSPQEFVDQFIPLYNEVWNMYEISYTTFARTTEKKHILGAQKLIAILQERGDIYKDVYSGWYCTPCETFVNEDTKVAPLCPSCARETVMVQEETYFFRLSAYQEKLLAFYKNNPDFITPSERFNEVIKFVESGLKDFSISRTTVSWGVAFPNDTKHTVYVWAEALCSYLTAVGYGNDVQQEQFKQFWPPTLQVLGKDIIRFHAVYWPAFLMAAELSIPKKLLVHGWIRVGHEKMSKSKGNAVDPIPLAQTYGSDEVRYFLMRYLAVNQDGEFSYQHLHEVITADLANDLGNLLNRVLLLAEKYNVTSVDSVSVWHDTIILLRGEALDMIADYRRLMDGCSFHLAVARLWQFIKRINAFFHEMEPWKLAKQDTALFLQVISATCHSLRIVGILASVIMPTKMAQLLATIGITVPAMDAVTALEDDIWHQHFIFNSQKTGMVLFKKWEPFMIEEAAQKEESIIPQNYIEFDDFIKVDLTVGTIVQAEAVAKSDKLLKLQVDFGPLGLRQILSGIAKHFKPEDLIGRKTVFVTNLKPRMMMGMESRGMLLTAENPEKGLSLVMINESIENGIRLK